MRAAGDASSHLWPRGEVGEPVAPCMCADESCRRKREREIEREVGLLQCVIQLPELVAGLAGHEFVPGRSIVPEGGRRRVSPGLPVSAQPISSPARHCVPKSRSETGLSPV